MQRWTIFIVLLLSVTMVSCAGRHSKNFYFGNYSEAEKHFNDEEYEDAIAKYRAYIDDNPEGNLAVIAEYYIGRSYAALGNQEEARSYFEDIIDGHPDLVWANFSKAQLKEMDEAKS